MINKINGYKMYGISKTQEEAIYARQVEDTETQVRIAEGSNNRLVLLNLAMNPNLSSDAVQHLFSRDLEYVKTRLEALGYKRDFFNFW